MSGNWAELGKKVFFLYPHNAVEEYFHLDLIKNEFEVYLLRDHRALPYLLKKFPTAIVFLNIDEVLNESEWLAYTQNLQRDFPQVTIGVFSIYNSPILSQKYLMDLGIKGGYITLRSGMENARATILQALIANEARGRRRYIRVRPPEGHATFNVKIGGRLEHGTVYDFSSVGFSAVFDRDDIDLEEGSMLSDLQLVFKGLRIKADVRVLLKRQLPGKRTTYVFLFGENLLPVDRDKIHVCVLRALQVELQKWLDEVPKK